MTRRWSLAAAFLLTVVCGFLIVSFGSSTGVFAWADRSGQSTGAVQAQQAQSDTLTLPAADISVTDASIPVDYGTAGTNRPDASRDEDDKGEHPEGDGGDGGYDDGGDRD